MLSSPKFRSVNSMVMRLKAFEDARGYVSLTNILLRPLFVDDSRENIIERLNSGFMFLSLPQDCYDFMVFDALLGHMTLEEKARHLARLVEMFKFLLPRHPSLSSANSCSLSSGEERTCVSNFLTLYVEVVRGAEHQGTSGELVRLVEYVMGTIPVEWDSLVPHMDPNALDYVLTCFSDERFHHGSIMVINLHLTWMLNSEMFFAVFIRHGFKYSFQQTYYSCCGELLKQDGFCPTENILLAFKESGNLRMQMAAEILMQLLRPIRKREIFYALWQSVPYPFITPDELYHLMKNFFVQGSSVLLDACAWYPNLLPGVPREKQPRSLKHLARVQIRESMVRGYSLGEKAIRSLGLPKTLEDYLWKLEAF